MHPIFADARLNANTIPRGLNHINHSEQERSIHGLVADLEAATSEMDAHADALQLALQHTKDQRKRCGELLKNYKSLIAPIFSIPDDVLLLIFDFYVEIEMEHEWQTLHLIDKGPLTLSHVCSSWRRLLLNSPLQWSKREVEANCVAWEDRDDALSLFDMFLERTGSHSFPMRIILTNAQFDTSMSKAIGDSANLWRSLELDQCANDAPMEYFGFPRPADTLEMLNYDLRLTQGGDTSYFFRQFEQCENIHDLRLVVLQDDENVETYTPRLMDITETGFHWGRLTTLHLYTHYPACDVLGILRACCWLEELQLDMPDFQDEYWMKTGGASGVRVSMTRLVKLELPTSNIFLFSIHCPALEELQLGSLAPEPLALFFNASRPPLRTLHLNLQYPLKRNTEGNIDISRVFAAFPKVETLVLDCTQSTLSDTLSVRTSSPNSGLDLLPSSKHVFLNVYATIREVCTPDYSAPILAFLDAHWRANERRLESVTLIATGGNRFIAYPRDVYYPPSDEIRATPLLEALCAYRQEGLKVHISASPSWIGAYIALFFCALRLTSSL